MPDFILLALVAALVAFAIRILTRNVDASAVRQSLDTMPGASWGTAVPITSFHAISRFLEENHCPCGGTLDVASEATHAGMQVVIAECDRCEERVTLHFDLTQMPN